ncbi:MAG: hypothetical protein CVT59_08540 [Actinobacteria bacterium HGW-Actinobacteria-1]|jgi:hypothetical protein|nr:MAG: hypothetical protein CVT59_08540 [Actinobacteria bacterium HGW-Actinobacteria-1]
MKRTDVFTKALAIAGTVLVLVPIAAPIVFSVASLIQGEGLRFDWLMPAELGSVALVGGVLVLIAALRAHDRRLLVGVTAGIAVAAPVAGAVIANLTGLANGEVEPGGWESAVVLVFFALFAGALIALGVEGGVVSRDLFRRNAAV